MFKTGERAVRGGWLGRVSGLTPMQVSSLIQSQS